MSDADFKADTTTASRLFFSEVLSMRRPAPGDCHVSAIRSPMAMAPPVDANHRWPDLLARTAAKGGRRPCRGAERGDLGRRSAQRPVGTNTLARFDRDVLAQPHAVTVVVMMGINDIGWPGSALAPTQRHGAQRRLKSSSATAAD